MEEFRDQGYHPVTRWLHAGLVLGVAYQLAFAAFMTHPDEKGSALGELFMQAHRTGGLIVVVIVAANLIWAILPRGNPLHRQISVLVSTAHWRDAFSILKLLPAMLLGKRELVKPGNALALVFEMLGLLTMTAMAATGTVIWNLWPGPGGTVSPPAKFLMDMHASVAVMLLFYLAGHISMALVHARAGDPVFARILPLSKRTSITQGGNHDVNPRLNSQKHEINPTRKRC